LRKGRKDLTTKLPTLDGTIKSEVLPKETWTEWGKRNKLWIISTTLSLFYFGFNEYRAYSAAAERKENKQAIANAGNTLHADILNIGNKANQNATDIQTIDGKVNRAGNDIADVDSKVEKVVAEVQELKICITEERILRGNSSTSKGSHSIPIPRGGDRGGSRAGGSHYKPPAHSGPQSKSRESSSKGSGGLQLRGSLAIPQVNEAPQITEAPKEDNSPLGTNAL